MAKYLICLAALFLGGAFVASCGGNASAPTAPNPSSATNVHTAKRIRPVGYIDRADCNAISGWVFDKDRPEEPLQLELYADDELQGKLQASALLRKDLLDAKIGTGKYGFLFPIPMSLKDGKPHAIKLKAEGSDYELEFWMSTPRFISCQP